MFNEHQLSSLERWLREWLIDGGLSEDDVSGLTVSVEENYYYYGKSEPYEYSAHYTYESRGNKLRSGLVFFNAHVLSNGLEDVAFAA